ncbi:IS3 family transposase [Kineococcus radiotolerans]|uniref:IS3 family transposase n=1 Tax=Kineococcus radiotolerans TaxID=131568 RepID=UPI0023AF0916|nr:IS3 family transposase [Kineococcus radiotolerans]
MIDVLVDAGHPVKLSCRLLGVSSPGYYRYKHRPIAPRTIRREWLTGLIREVYTASRQTYGSRRVHAVLTQAMGVQVSERLVAVLMSLAGIAGLPGPAKVKRLSGIAIADDWCTASFIGCHPTSCGSPTSPSIPPGRARCTAAR